MQRNAIETQNADLEVRGQFAIITVHKTGVQVVIDLSMLDSWLLEVVSKKDGEE